MRELHGSTLIIDVDELIVAEQNCPRCGLRFVPWVWDEREGYYYPHSEHCTYYDCPMECNGTIALHV